MHDLTILLFILGVVFFWLGLIASARDNRKGQGEIARALHRIADELEKRGAGGG